MGAKVRVPSWDTAPISDNFHYIDRSSRTGGLIGMFERVLDSSEQGCSFGGKKDKFCYQTDVWEPLTVRHTLQNDTFPTIFAPFEGLNPTKGT